MDAADTLNKPELNNMAHTDTNKERAIILFFIIFGLLNPLLDARKSCKFLRDFGCNN
jgi:hypothetical protein